MREHELKLDTNYFDAVRDGEKNFEVRRDDRGFQKGDVLVLKRWEMPSGLFPAGTYLRERGNGGPLNCNSRFAETIRREITYILTGGQFGIEGGYVVLGLKEIDQ